MTRFAAERPYAEGVGFVNGEEVSGVEDEVADGGDHHRGQHQLSARAPEELHLALEGADRDRALQRVGCDACGANRAAEVELGRWLWYGRRRSLPSRLLPEAEHDAGCWPAGLRIRRCFHFDSLPRFLC